MNDRAIEKNYDILVAGGGFAGVSAALASSKQGSRVALIERQNYFGGMACGAWVGTICGAFFRNRESPKYLQAGLMSALCELIIQKAGGQPQIFAEGLWYIPYSPEKLQSLLKDILLSAGVELITSSNITAVELGKNRIQSVHLDRGEKTYHVAAEFFLDCTGNGLISSLSKAPMITATSYQAGAIVFEVSGIELTSLRDLQLVINRAVIDLLNRGLVPQLRTFISVVPGSLNAGSALLKLSLPELQAPSCDYQSLQSELYLFIPQLIELLKTTAQELQSLNLIKIAPELGVRTGPRPLGLCKLKKSDLTEAIKSSDGVAKAAWPQEFWGSERSPKMVYFSENQHYDISMQCLISAAYDNLLFAGRAFSADEEAISSARVIGTCIATGEAIGSYAASIVRGESYKEAVEIIQKQREKEWTFV